MKRIILVFSIFAVCHMACGQARPTATRAGDLQIGADYAVASSDYGFISNRIRGVGFYADFDFLPHFGAEVDFHQLNDPAGSAYERSYEAGGRYLRQYGRFTPYARGAYGRGILNYPYGEGNLAYNLFTGAGGIDTSLHPRISLRVEYEYQRWSAAPGILHGLTPELLTVGVAYHFGGGLRRSNRSLRP